MRTRSKPVRRRPRRARSRRIAAPAGSDPCHTPITSLLSDHVPGHVSSHVTRTTLTPQHLFPPHPFHAPVPGLHSPGGKVRPRFFRSCVRCLLHATHSRTQTSPPTAANPRCMRAKPRFAACDSLSEVSALLAGSAKAARDEIGDGITGDCLRHPSLSPSSDGGESGDGLASIRPISDGWRRLEHSVMAGPLDRRDDDRISDQCFECQPAMPRRRRRCGGHSDATASSDRGQRGHDAPSSHH